MQGKLAENFFLFLGYVRNSKLNEPTGLHFNLPGHKISMLKASILEKCFHSSLHNIQKTAPHANTKINPPPPFSRKELFFNFFVSFFGDYLLGSCYLIYIFVFSINTSSHVTVEVQPANSLA